MLLTDQVSVVLWQGWLKCEDSACGARTRRVPMVFAKGYPLCHVCNRGFLVAEVGGESSLVTICKESQQSLVLDLLHMKIFVTWINDLDAIMKNKMQVT